MRRSRIYRILKVLAIFIISACMFLVPFDAMGLHLNPVEIGAVALFVLAALLWITELIPIWATSVIVIALALLCLSNQSFSFFKPEKFDQPAVRQLIIDACGPDAPAQVAALQESVITRLNSKPRLSPEEIRLTLTQQTWEAYERACLRAETLTTSGDLTGAATCQQTAARLKTAAERFYRPEFAQRIREIRITNVMQQKATMATFADPIIILFLGGFFLAAAATKYRLDINLAKVLLKPFGTQPKYVLLGLMCITGGFSMFMSNTATTAMMLAILTPVLTVFDHHDRGRIAFALAIPISANIGGIGTPIGTPPNAIALKALQEMGLNVTFAKWMCFGIPIVIILLLIAWYLLIKLFPIQRPTLQLRMRGKFIRTPRAYVVYATFIITVTLWITGDFIGLDSNTIAIIPIAVFAGTQVITKHDLRHMSWETLWLVAGGFALGLALQDTGLAGTLIGAIPFGTWDLIMLMTGAAFICTFMATFMSNTATASLLMPIIMTAAASLITAGSIDTATAIALLCCTGIACSLGMALPISTPPNALAYATNLIPGRSMLTTGLIIGLIGLTIVIILMRLLAHTPFFA